MIRKIALLLALAVPAYAQIFSRTASAVVGYSSSLPATCRTNAVAIDSSYRLNVCGPDNTWTAISASSAPFSDATALVKNASDATKLYALDLSGLAAATTVTESLNNSGAHLFANGIGGTTNGVLFFNQGTGLYFFQNTTSGRGLTLDTTAFTSTKRTWGFPSNVADNFVGATVTQAISGKTYFSGTPTTADSGGDNLLAASATTQTPLVLQVKAVPTADWFRVESSAGSTGAGFRVQSDGGAIINQQTGATFSNVLAVQYQGVNQFVVAYNGSSTSTGPSLASSFNAAGGAWTVDTNGWQDINPGKCYVSSDQTNATTALASTTCSMTLQNASHYRGQCELFLSDSVAADGAKIDFGGGAANASNFRAQVTAFDTALNLSTQVTSITSTASATTFTGSGAFEVHFSIETSATGTFIPRFAQVGHTTGTLTLAKGSYCSVEKMP